MATTAQHGYSWDDARIVHASELEPGDVFIKLAPGTAYTEHDRGRIAPVVLGAGTVPLDGTLWTVLLREGNVLTARSRTGELATETIPSATHRMVIVDRVQLPFVERPSDEILPGDVIAYDGGGLLLVTSPGKAEQIPFTGRRITHHGLILTTPGRPWKKSEGTERTTTPRAKITVFGRYDMHEGARCLCRWHRERRGDTATLALPSVAWMITPPTTDAPAAPLAVPPAPARNAIALAPNPAWSTEVPDAAVTASARVVAEAPVTPQDDRSVIQRLADACAPLLGEGWSSEETSSRLDRTAALVHTDGRRLEIQETRSRTHVEVSVVYPPDPPVHLYASDYPVTRFRKDRPAADLANAILGKVRPLYDAKYAAVAKAIADLRQRQAVEDSFADRLAALVPGGFVARREPSPWVQANPGPRGSIERMRVDVSLHDHLHTAEFRYIDSEILEALVQTYGAMVKARQERRAAPGAQVDVP